MPIESAVEARSEEQEIKSETGSPPTTHLLDSSRSTPTKSTSHLTSPDFSNTGDMHTPKDEEKIVRGDITVKMEPGQPLKLARSSTQKVTPRPAELYDHLPDQTEAATSRFEVISDCVYMNKYLGYTEHAMECDCAEEYGKQHSSFRSMTTAQVSCCPMLMAPD